MKKYLKKLLLISVFFMQALNCAQAENISSEDLILPKNPAYRLGFTYTPEKEYKVTDLASQIKSKTAVYDEEYLKNNSYADSTLKELSREISKTLSAEKPVMLEHIQILWAGAALKSETIKFALYKLSNPDEDKPDEKIIKKIIRPLSTVSSIAAAGLGDPISASAAMFGGHLLNSLSFNDKDLNYKYTKVTDADMIVLLSKVDNLQKKVIDKYYDYMTSRKLLYMSEKNLKMRSERLNSGGYETEEQLLTADAFYRSAADTRDKLRLEFLENRAALEQISGPEALLEFEKKLDADK